MISTCVWVCGARTSFQSRQRSLIMSRIRSKNTTLDLTMRRLLRRSGVPFKMYPALYGKPDFLVACRIALFCDSSFWHGRNWSILRKRLQTGSNSEYWIRHIRKNRKRDLQVTHMLRSKGYIVIRLWDTQISKDPQYCIDLIRAKLVVGSSSKQVQNDNLTNHYRQTWDSAI